MDVLFDDNKGKSEEKDEYRTSRQLWVFLEHEESGRPKEIAMSERTS